MERGIEWGFTLEGWIRWWEEQLGLDWLRKRGCRRGQFVMARNMDEGPYVSWNVKCITAEENHAEYNYRRRPQQRWTPPLDRETVIAIFLDEGGPTYLSKKYGVTKHKVYCIKTQRYFKQVTDQFVDEKRLDEVKSLGDNLVNSGKMDLGWD